MKKIIVKTSILSCIVLLIWLVSKRFVLFIELYQIMLFVVIAYVIFLYLRFPLKKQTKRIKRLLWGSTIFIPIWYALLPYIAASQSKNIRFEEMVSIAILFGAIVFITLIIYIYKEIPDLDQNGNSRWRYISRGQYMIIFITTISIWTATILSIYFQYDIRDMGTPIVIYSIITSFFLLFI